MTNLAAAQRLSTCEAPGLTSHGIYRSRPPLPEKKLRALRWQIEAMVSAHTDELRAPDEWRWRADEELATWAARLKTLPLGKRSERAIAQVWRAQVDAVRAPLEYTRVPRTHDELKVPVYGRVTASLREAVSFVNQALLGARLTLERSAATVALSDADRAALWDHLMMAALVEPVRCSQQRGRLMKMASTFQRTADHNLAAAVGRFLQAASSVPAVTAEERQLVDQTLDRAIASTTRAKEAIGRIAGAAQRAARDDLWLTDLGGLAEADPSRPAPARAGRIERVAPGHIEVRLDDPELVVTLDTADLARGAGETFVLRDDGVALVSSAGQRLVLGAAISVRATRHDGRQLRFRVVT